MSDVRLGPFHLETLLGRGAMGEVWRGRHADQGTAVAVKLITGAAARDPEWQASFRDEVRAAARLDHPEIVLLFDHGRVDADAARASRGRFTEGAPWLVMELASGGSLDRLKGAVPWGRARAALASVLRALAHAHARGVVHRDLKPANILVSTPDDLRPGLKLCDFGIAAAEGAETAPTGAMLGTPAYMAPEMVAGRWREHGPWTDLYALGALAWRLTCGRTPFQHLETMAVLRAQMEEPPPPFAPITPVPPGLADWVARLLAKDPRDRYQRAAHALHDLLALDGSAPREDFPELADPTPSATPPLAGVGLGLLGLRPIPLAGRETERDCLWELLREVHRTRKPRLALVRGASGVGKSRLIDHVAERAHELGVAEVVRGTCADPSREILAKHLGEGAPDTTLRTLLGNGRTWILALDDAHLGGDALDLVAGLLRQDRGPLPVLVLLAADDAALADRPDVAARLDALLAHPGALSFPLGPLTGTASLVRDRLGLEPHLAAAVEERTSGNPLFAVRLVTGWAEAGLLAPTPAGFALTPGARADLPEDFVRDWTDRVRRAVGGPGEGHLAWLEIAAALGQEVDGEAWARATGPGTAVERAAMLDRLEAARLIERVGSGFRFAHATLREVIEEGARRAGRHASAHAACAGVVTGPGRLGRHLLAAGRAEEAVPLLVGAAWDACRRTTMQGALALADRAAEAIEQAGLSATDPRRGDLAWVQAWILRNLGYVDLAHREIEAAVAAARQHRWPALLRIELVRALIGLLRNDPEVGGRMRSVLERARSSGDPALIGEAYTALATEALVRGGPEAGILAENGLAKLLEAGDELGAARCLRQLAAFHGPTDPAAARAHLLRAVDIFRRHDSPIGLAYCWNGLAELARHAGDAEEAEDLYRRSLAILEETGDADVAVIRVNLAITALVRGSVTDAAAAVRPVVRTLEQRGRRMVLAAARLCLCPAAAADLDWPGFESHLRGAVELVVETGAVDRDLAYLFGAAADVADRAGKRPLARVAWRQAARQWRGIGEDRRADQAEECAT